MAYTSDRAFELIAAADERGRLAHAFLISGAVGCGKESLAARLIQLVNKSPQSGGGFDLFGEPVPVTVPALDELESGWVRVLRPRMKSRRIGVDEIRDLEHTLHLAAPGGACKVGFADVIIGGTMLAAEYIGVEKVPHIQEKIIDMVRLSETSHACAIAAAVFRFAAHGEPGVESIRFFSSSLILRKLPCLLFSGNCIFSVTELQWSRSVE